MQRAQAIQDPVAPLSPRQTTQSKGQRTQGKSTRGQDAAAGSGCSPGSATGGSRRKHDNLIRTHHAPRASQVPPPAGIRLLRVVVESRTVQRREQNIASMHACRPTSTGVMSVSRRVGVSAASTHRLRQALRPASAPPWSHVCRSGGDCGQGARVGVPSRRSTAAECARRSRTH